MEIYLVRYFALSLVRNRTVLRQYDDSRARCQDALPRSPAQHPKMASDNNIQWPNGVQGEEVITRVGCLVGHVRKSGM